MPYASAAAAWDWAKFWLLCDNKEEEEKKKSEEEKG